MLRIQKVDTSKQSEFDRRRRNLEQVVSKIARDLDAVHTRLELHQGKGIHQDSISSDPVLNIGGCVCRVTLFQVLLVKQKIWHKKSMCVRTPQVT